MTGFDDYLYRLKSSASLRSLFESDGIQLAREGNRLKCCCPFHQENTPSCIVFEDEGRFHCFGCQQRGDAIDYIQTRRGMDFIGAVSTLASLLGMPMPEREAQDEAASASARDAAAFLDDWCGAAHSALLADEAALSYVQGQGLTLDTIREHRIGLAVPVPAGQSDLASRIGLLDGDGRLTVHGRIIFPIRRGGRTVNVAARVYQDPDAKPKYKNLPGQPTTPFNSHLLRSSGSVVLAEGVKDVLLLGQAGIPGVATIGTYFKPEWLPLCGRETHYLLCYDNDSTGANIDYSDPKTIPAGEKGCRRVASVLFEAGHRCSVVGLPQGKDPADLVSEGRGPELKRCLQLAKPWPDYVIDTLPAIRSPYEMADQLHKIVFPILAKLPAVAVDPYIPALAKRYNVRIPAIRQEWDEHKKGAGSPGAAPAGDSEDVTPIFRENNPITFNPAQFFGAGLGVFTVHTEVTGAVGLHPFLVTSDRRMRPLNAQVASELGFVFAPNKYPDPEVRWPIGTRYQNCVQSYLHGKIDVQPGRLFNSVEGLLRRHIYWPDEWGASYDLVTLWCIGTYVHQVFNSFPYIHVRALPDSGKSTLLNLISVLAFNGRKADAITESVISRTVNSDSATLLIDEAEHYTAQDAKEDGSFIFEVLKGGYKKGATVRKAGTKKENFRPESFDIYSPKMFASTQPIDPILATRCLDVPLMRAANPLPPLLVEEIDAELQELRGHAYAWALSGWESVRECYLAQQPDEGWFNRSWELWKPILALADYFSPAVGRDLSVGMHALATTIRERAAARNQEQNNQQRVMSAILDWIDGNTENYPDEWYPASVLCDAVKDELGWEKFTPEALSRFLCDEAHICDRRTDKEKRRGPAFLRPVSHVRIERRRAYEQAVRMFSFPAAILNRLPDSPVIEEECPFDE